MFYRSLTTIVFVYYFIAADIRAQSQLISKLINITTIIGETIEMNCSEYMDPYMVSTSSVFTWLKSDKSIRLGELLRITNITNNDEGTYECHISNEFQNDYSIYTLTIIRPPKRKNYHRSTFNVRKVLGEHINIYCSVAHFFLSMIEKYRWFKDEKPILINEDNKRLSWKWNGGIPRLSINYVIYEDNGKYECLAFNKFGIYSTVYYLNVTDRNENIDTKLPNEVYYNSFNGTNYLGEGLTWKCYVHYIEKWSNVNYTWTKNNKPLKLSDHITMSHDNYELQFTDVTFNEAGSYKCFASNGHFTYISKKTLNIIDYPEKSPYRWYTSYIKLTTGVALHLRCNKLRSTQNYKTGYSWKKNGNPLILIGNSNKIFFENNEETLIFEEITSSENVTFECEAENYYHKYYSVYTLNVVDPKFPEIYNTSKATPTTIVNSGNSLQLYCYVRGMPTPNISWWKNDYPFDIPENNDRIMFQDYKQKLSFKFTVPKDGGFYKCKVSNKLGSKTAVYNININDNKMNNEKSYSVIIYLIICSAIFLILLSGVFMLYNVIILRRKKASNIELEANKLKFLNGEIEKWNTDFGIEEQTDLLPYDKQWEFPKNKLKLGKKLGSGAFGLVYKANAIGIKSTTTSTTVAVKMAKSNSDSSHAKALISELKIMIHIGKHLNIVNVLGACTEDITNNLMVIVEFCRFGCLRDYLLRKRDNFVNQFSSDSVLKDDKNIFRLPKYQNVPNEKNVFDRYKNFSTPIDSEGDHLGNGDEQAWLSNYRGDYQIEKTSPLSTKGLFSWSFQISRGMEYLSSKKVLHGDLAVRNILLADDNVVKIADFGLAKGLHNYYDSYKMSDKVSLPVKWMAIEALRDQVISTKSDVWSFGIVLWELFSLAETPYPDIISFSDLYNRLVNGYRMSQPKYANDQIYNVMYDCWNTNPKSRPSFIDLTRRISDLLEDCSKSYYTKLEEQFIKMNNKTSPSADYENVLSSSNNPSMSIENPDLCSENSKRSDSNDVLEMKPIINNQCYS